MKRKCFIKEHMSNILNEISGYRSWKLHFYEVAERERERKARAKAKRNKANEALYKPTSSDPF